MKKQLLGAFLAGLLSVVTWEVFVPRLALAATCALKTWSAGQGVLATDLNNNFSCINALTQNITDANVAAGAAIQYTKLQFPANYPKAWAEVAACSVNGACTISEGSRITSVTRTGTGAYTVVLAYTPPNANYAVWVQPGLNGGAPRNDTCQPSTLATTSPNFTINCSYNAAGTPTAEDPVMFILVFDADNV